VPAAAVIPALQAYVKTVAVEKLVVERRKRRRRGDWVCGEHCVKSGELCGAGLLGFF